LPHKENALQGQGMLDQQQFEAERVGNRGEPLALHLAIDEERFAKLNRKGAIV
jgi:hypothetical protein